LSEAATKRSHRREATLYRPLAGAGARAGQDDAGGDAAAGMLEALREAGLRAYEALELPLWRRSGFWTTSFAELDLGALEVRHHQRQDVPEAVARTLPERSRAGRIVQLDGSVVHVELDPSLRERGVTLCPLEDAASEGHPAFERWYSRRLTVDRHKLEAANAAFWTGGAFLHVPEGVAIADPFEIVSVIGGAGSAQHARVLIVGEPTSDFRVHEYALACEFAGQALHTEAFELYLRDGARCRLAHFHDWGSGDVYDSSTRFVGVGRDAYCHWLPALLGGSLVHQHLELAVMEPGGEMAFRGLFFTEADEQLDAFAVDLHEAGPSQGDVHWRGAATGSSRASMEGLIKIDQGAQQSHTYLQIHSMMLSPRARIDTIPSVLVSADDVSASHGGSVGELDEDAIFYMQSRGLDRPTAVRVIVEGFFEPLIEELQDAPLESLVRARIADKLAAAHEDIESYAASR
jgi:Fe-S cluster assembly scaffold protein SufB